MQTYLSLLQKEIIYEKTFCYSAVKIQLIKIKYYKNKLMLHKNTETWEIIKHFLWNLIVFVVKFYYTYKSDKCSLKKKRNKKLEIKKIKFTY